MARAYFYIVDQGSNWTIRFERRNYGMFGSEAAAYSQATQWARDQGKDGHDGQVFVRLPSGKYRARWAFHRDAYPPEELSPELSLGPAAAPPPSGTASMPTLPRLFAVLALALALAASAASAEEVALGTVQICRQTGIVDANTGRPIVIPSGATFLDNTTFKFPSTGDDVRRIRIATIEPSQIAANAECTLARAGISRSDAGAPVQAAVGKRLSPIRAKRADLAAWPGAFYLFATVASEFR